MVRHRTQGRVLSWFSCGDPSAVAAKLSVEKWGDKCEVVYCNTFAFEHPDNRRFLADVEQWIGQKIWVLSSEEYTDIYDVFRRTRYLVGPRGARCTTELKKVVRKKYQRADDTHVFGFTSDEEHRVARFHQENPDLLAEFPLIEQGISKDQCHTMVRRAGIEIPAMYKLGYKNNNCIGCVKGGKGYWNKIRVDFPEAFHRMAKMERELNVAINTINEGRVKRRCFLDELPPNAGHHLKEPDIECGVLCTHEQEKD